MTDYGIDYELTNEYLIIHLLEYGEEGREWSKASANIPLNLLKKKLEEVQ